MIELGYVYCFRMISKISQATGLRDPEYGCSLGPFSFLEAGYSGNQGKSVSSSSSRPVWCHDCNRGQHPASSEVSMTALDKIKAFFKRPKSEAETKVAEAPEKKGDESSSK